MPSASATPSFAMNATRSSSRSRTTVRNAATLSTTRAGQATPPPAMAIPRTGPTSIAPLYFDHALDTPSRARRLFGVGREVLHLELCVGPAARDRLAAQAFVLA